MAVKTTLLRAIAGVIAGGHMNAWLIRAPRTWVRHGAEEGRVDLELDARHTRDDARADGDLADRCSIGVTWRSGGGQQHHLPRQNHNFVYTRLWSHEAEAGSGWFFAAYGASRNSAPSTSLSEELLEGPPRRAAITTLFRSDATLQPSLDWVQRTMHPARLEGDQHALRVVEAIERTLASLGQEVFGRPTATRIDSKGIWFERPEGTIALADIGLGAEAVVSLVLDIIRRLHDSIGPDFMGDAANDDAGPVIRRSGVVLIDEAENHLHPQVQQRLSSWFKLRFPRLQFIVTTHSPFICQGADHLIRLDGGQLSPVSDDVFNAVVNGSADDAVLTALFGLPFAHSPAAERLREKIARLGSRIRRGLATPEEAAERRDLLLQLPRGPSQDVARALAEWKREL